jgi:hypothetical protein
MASVVTGMIAAPVANLLIVAGLVFLLIAVVGDIAGRLQPGKTGRIASGLIGIVLLGVGLGMFASLPSQKPQNPVGSEGVDDARREAQEATRRATQAEEQLQREREARARQAEEEQTPREEEAQEQREKEAEARTRHAEEQRARERADEERRQAEEDRRRAQDQRTPETTPSLTVGDISGWWLLTVSGYKWQFWRAGPTTYGFAAYDMHERPVGGGTAEVLDATVLRVHYDNTNAITMLRVSMLGMDGKTQYPEGQSNEIHLRRMGTVRR